MIGNAALWLSLIWLPILLYIMLRNETKFKKNIAVGVTLPFDGRTHPAVLARLAQFQKEEFWLCILFTVLCIPGIFVEFSMSITLWFLWMTACVIVPYIPYVLCNRDLKQIKVNEGWKQSNLADTVTVDLRAMPNPKWLSPWTFVPALLMSLLPLLFEHNLAVLYLIDASLILFFWLAYRYLYRNKSEIVDNNTTVTVALTRIRRNQWGKMWLLCAYSVAVLNWIAYLTMYSPTAMTIGLVGFMAVLLVASLYIEFHTRKLQETLTADSGKEFYIDDDDHWLGGLVYYNPNDNRTIINNRVGTNTSVNLAKPVGKAIYAVTALLIVTLPLWGLLLGDSNIHTEIRSDSLLIEGGMHEYTIEAEDIVQLELLEELPVITRIGGTGMPEFLGGDFSSKEYGKLKVCLDPTAPPFVLIETDHHTYLLGTNNEQQTLAMYEALQ